MDILSPGTEIKNILMSDLSRYSKTIESIDKHPAKWEKELYHFVYSNRNTPYQVDLYYYPDTHKFSEFGNIGGNSWLDDDHITVYSVNNEFSEEWVQGRIRETAAYYKEHVSEIVDQIRDELMQEVELRRAEH